LIPLSILPSSLGSHLLPTEEVLSLSPSIGLYSNSIKLPHHQDGTIYLTSHRIIYIDSTSPRTKSGYLRLDDVKLTEYYAGFLKSSPKDEMAMTNGMATMGMSAGNTASAAAESSAANGYVSTAPVQVQVRWVCSVCGFSNQGVEGGTESCQLCGVRRDPSASTSASKAPPPISSAQRLGPPSLRTSAASLQSTPPPPSPPIPTSGPEIACPACTFLNHPSMPSCEVCGTSLSTAQLPAPIRSAPVPPSEANSLPTTPAISRPATPAAPKGPVGEVTVKLSFRKGGDKAFYEALDRAMRRAAWKRTAPTSSIDAARDPSRPSSAGAVVGIDGLLNAYSHKSALESSDMSTALQDLRGLMAKAKDMVDLAESLNAKLSKREAEHATGEASEDGEGGEEEAATLIRSSLVKLGLPTTAVTKEMARDEEEYHRELARELGYVLLGGRNVGSGNRGAVGSSTSSSPTSDRPRPGILTLDEIWCTWNRLRGIALVPPTTLLSTLPYLVADLTQPRIFYTTLPRSGLRVVHLEEFSEGRVRERVLRSTDFGRPLTTLQVAQAEGISILLTQELLHLVEMESGAIVRD
ncbi:hypothetical protein BCV69DRAFT_232331, partial [Microstroma glucosiphilum]